MPIISILRRITIYMHFTDSKHLELPHLHARYLDDEVSVSISGGEILKGNFPEEKMEILQDWIKLHQEDLMSNWEMIASGLDPYKIEPLDGSVNYPVSDE